MRSTLAAWQRALSLALVWVACIAVMLLPAPTWILHARHPVLGCARAAERALEVRRGERPPTTVTVRSDRWRQTAEVLECDGERFDLASASYSSPSGPMTLPPGSTVRLRVRADGRVDAVQYCLGCELSRETATAPAVLVTVLAALVMAAGFLAAAHASRRSPPRALRWLGAGAPTAARPERPPTTTDAVHLQPARSSDVDRSSDGAHAGAPAAGPCIRWEGGAARSSATAEGAHLRLGSGAGPFRERGAARVELVGPGRVNGTRVDPGARAIVCDGDVVRIGGSEPIAVSFVAGSEPVVRHRFLGEDGEPPIARYRLGVRAEPTRHPLWALAALPVGLAGLVAAPVGMPSSSWFGAWLVAGAALFGAAATATRWAVRYATGELAVGPGGARWTMPGEAAVAIRSLERRARGAAWEVVAVGVERAERVAERSRRPSRFDSPDEHALARVLASELDVVASELAAAHAPAGENQ